MNQKELLNRFKNDLNSYPSFFKELIQKPIHVLDSPSRLDWIQIFFYCYLTEALFQTLYNILTFQFSGLFNGILFMPIQVLIIVSFLSFVIWFALDKLKYSHISFFQILKSLSLIQIVSNILLFPLLMISIFIKNFELSFVVHALAILLKCYLLYRVLFQHHKVQAKNSMAIAGCLALLFVLPIVSSFIEDYDDHLSLKQKEQYNEKVMEESIRAIEEEFKK